MINRGARIKSRRAGKGLALSDSAAERDESRNRDPSRQRDLLGRIGKTIRTVTEGVPWSAIDPFNDLRTVDYVRLRE